MYLKNTYISNLMKIRPVGGLVFPCERTDYVRTDGQTEDRQT